MGDSQGVYEVKWLGRSIKISSVGLTCIFNGHTYALRLWPVPVWAYYEIDVRFSYPLIGLPTYVRHIADCHHGVETEHMGGTVSLDTLPDICSCMRPATYYMDFQIQCPGIISLARIHDISLAGVRRVTLPLRSIPDTCSLKRSTKYCKAFEFSARKS